MRNQYEMSILEISFYATFDDDLHCCLFAMTNSNQPLYACPAYLGIFHLFDVLVKPVTLFVTHNPYVFRESIEVTVQKMYLYTLVTAKFMQAYHQGTNNIYLVVIFGISQNICHNIYKCIPSSSFTSIH